MIILMILSSTHRIINDVGVASAQMWSLFFTLASLKLEFCVFKLQLQRMYLN